MGVVTSRRRVAAALLLFAVFFFFATAVVVAATARPMIRVPPSAPARRKTRIDSSTQLGISSSRTDGVSVSAVQPRRRRLVGPGSSPPTCRGRCGRCAPCRAARVAIQPGVAPQWEYYPEVWRCKCGDKLFMP